MPKLSNDKKIERYINNNVKNKTEVPYITRMSKDTGISPATISRYARKKGYYSFSSLRAKHNEKITNIFNDEGFSRILKPIRNIYIVSSNGTTPIANYIHYRLTELNKKVTIVKTKIDETISKATISTMIIMITMSGNSLRIKKSIAASKKGLLITGNDKLEVKKGTKKIIIKDLIDNKDNSIIIRNNNIEKYYLWLNKSINLLTKLLKKK